MSKKIIIGGVAMAVLLVVLWAWQSSRPKPPAAAPDEAPPAEIGLSAPDAYGLGLALAQRWRADAVLAQAVSAASTTPSGRADDWQLLFVAASRPGRGYSVSVRDKSARSGEEVPYASQGGLLPDRLLPAQRAIDQLHRIKGYETELVSGVELVYGPEGQAWYWALKTAKGVVTIDARQ